MVKIGFSTLVSDSENTNRPIIGFNSLFVSMTHSSPIYTVLPRVGTAVMTATSSFLCDSAVDIALSNAFI